MRARAYMDALASASSSTDDDDDGGGGARATTARATAPTIAYEALCAHGLREARLARAVDATMTSVAWSRGAREDASGGGYWMSESARTRDAVGEGSRETCARALEAARDGAREREAALGRRREEAALAKERLLEAKRALREDDSARRRREREETRGRGGEAGDGSDAKRSRRAPRIDLSTREAPVVDGEGADDSVINDDARGERVADDALARETDEKRLVETGGFDFGDGETT